MTAKIVRTKTVPPDGGWGWVVLFSALVVNFLIPGTVKSFGVLFVEFLHVFKATSTAASWMPALCYFLYNSLGPLSSFLSTKYSYKTVTLLGGTFAASGMMLSYFANSVSYLYVSYGLMVGIGAGLSFPPTVYIVTAYFERLRGFANGLCISGSAIGTIVLPPLLQYLLDCFGYRGAVLIMGAITLNTLVCALLYDPVEQHMIEVPIEEGIDNEALALDEPGLVEEKPQEAKAIKLNSSLQEAKTGSDESTGKQTQSLSELLKNTMPSTEESQDSSSMSVNATTEFTGNRRESTRRNSEEGEKSIIIGETVNECERHRGEKSEPANEESRTRGTATQPEETEKGNEKSSISRQASGVFETDIDADAEADADARVKLEKLATPRSALQKATSETSLAKMDAKDTPRFFDLSVLRDPIYLVILISNSTSAISNTNFMILLPSYAIQEGFDKNSSALLLSVVSALDLVGRIGGASLSDIDFVPKYYYFVGGLGTSGIALALLPMANSYRMLAFFCALFGLSSGMYIGITTVILADMLGMEKLSSSYGISLFVNGVLQLVGPPVCGVIFESVGTYKPIFLSFGIILILGTALWAVVPLINRNTKKDLEAA